MGRSSASRRWPDGGHLGTRVPTAVASLGAVANSARLTGTWGGYPGGKQEAPPGARVAGAGPCWVPGDAVPGSAPGGHRGRMEIAGRVLSVSGRPDFARCWYQRSASTPPLQFPGLAPLPHVADDQAEAGEGGKLLARLAGPLWPVTQRPPSVFPRGVGSVHLGAQHPRVAGVRRHLWVWAGHGAWQVGGVSPRPWTLFFKPAAAMLPT